MIVEYSGEGSDAVYSSVSHTLASNVERLTLTGTNALNGRGNDLANLISGNSGGNQLFGLAGDDRLYGRDGADRIEGGAGRDRLYGGPGSDRFVFDDGHFGGSTQSAADQIHDFNAAEGDRIDLLRVDANSRAQNDQAFTFIGSAAFSGSAGELRYQHVSGSTVVQGDTNGDGIADFAIRLDGLHALSSGDFVL